MIRILILLITFMVSTSVFGQQDKLSVGVEGGPNRIFLRGNEFIEEYHAPRIAFLGGVFFHYEMIDNFSLRTNVAFERKGSVANFSAVKRDLSGEAESVDFTIYRNYDYLTVPFLLRYTLGEQIRCFFNAGPYVGFLLRSSFSSKNPEREPSYDTETSKRLEFGLSAGVGIEVPVMERVSISCELRNNLGLTNISKVPVINEGTIKSNATNFLIGIAYHL